MIRRVPSRRRGALPFWFLTVLMLLWVGSAGAKVSRQDACEGDPGDGNLSPASAERWSPGGGSFADTIFEADGSGLDQATVYRAPLVILPSGAILPLDLFGWTPWRPAGAGSRSAVPFPVWRCGHAR